MTQKSSSPFVPDSASMQFLGELAAAAIESARVYPGQSVDNVGAVTEFPRNTLDYTVIRPGGRLCYPAVWTQDYSMTLATGFVTAEEMCNHLRLVAQGQNGPEDRQLKSGAVIPPYAIPDHTLFNGEPIFFPGSYSGEDQGGEPWGMRPPVNNHYDFILIAWNLWKTTGDAAFLQEEINGLPLIERLRLAFAEPRIDAQTGLAWTDENARAVGFIFCDSIYMTGFQLSASLIRWRAAGQLAQLERVLGDESRAKALEAEVENIPASLASTFGDPARIGGWLMGATKVGRQPDVWGTIYALYLGVLRGEPAAAALAEIVRALEEGTIYFRGALRHVPTNHNASTTSAWESTFMEIDTYQNGAYWPMPAGWLIVILAKARPDWAHRIFSEMITHLRQEDFRKGPEFNAPWECFGPNPAKSMNPVFVPSVTVPFGVLKEIHE